MLHKNVRLYFEQAVGIARIFLTESILSYLENRQAQNWI